MTAAPAHGSWPSALSAEAVAGAEIRLRDVVVDGATVYWVEQRPQENARCVLVRRLPDGTTTDITPDEMSVRTTVHEYGGAAVAACEGLVVVSTADNSLWLLDQGGWRPLVTEPSLRFADMIIDSVRRRVIAVEEDHRVLPARTTLVSVSLDDGVIEELVAGADFYSSPRLSPDGGRLAWILWTHPQMPWDGTELWVADLDPEGALTGPRRLAGGRTESIVQPLWDGSDLLCISDRSGHWNLCRATDAGLEAVVTMEADCARPHWVFGLSSAAILGDGTLAVCAAEQGVWSLWHGTAGEMRRLPLEYTALGDHCLALGDRIVVTAASPVARPSLRLIDPASGEDLALWSGPSPLAPELISRPEAVEFPTTDQASQAYGFLYRPHNPAVGELPEGRPPLLVRAHGGPTSQTDPCLDLEVQFWTSRGFAVLDVNYGGSTGYGRAYRRRLNGLTGCVDVDDCVAGADAMARRGECNRDAMVIRGGSAGGYIVLCAAVFYPEVFAAATSYYGISDCRRLAGDENHKFESRYYDSLIGPLPETESLYHNRSPVHFASRIRRPLLLLQGSDDVVVPPDQAEQMVAELRDLGVAHAYLVFEGEAHGFRRADSITRALEAELSFYAQVLGFTPADSVQGLHLATGRT